MKIGLGAQNFAGKEPGQAIFQTSGTWLGLFADTGSRLGHLHQETLEQSDLHSLVHIAFS